VHHYSFLCLLEHKYCDSAPVGLITEVTTKCLTEMATLEERMVYFLRGMELDSMKSYHSE
jgi:hypothetical protein